MTTTEVEGHDCDRRFHGTSNQDHDHFEFLMLMSGENDCISIADRRTGSPLSIRLFALKLLGYQHVVL